jgi:glycosyltransferase involved in cell wall biosynthesis
MKELRVGLFTGNYSHTPDGVSLTLNRWVAYLLGENIPVLVFSPTVRNPRVAHVGEVVPVPSIPMPGRPEYRLTLGFPRQARARFEAFGPTLVHLATPDQLGLQAMRRARAGRIQVVASYHTHFPVYLKYYHLGLFETLGWRFLRRFYGRVTHLYVPSSSIATELARKGIASDIRIWARGVDVTLFSPVKRDPEWRRSLGIPRESPVIAFVSRLVWEKNLRAVIDTFRMLSGRLPGATFLIVGEGPARQPMQRMLRGARFTGHLGGEDLARAYASSDVFFFPSVTETFGNVTLEAMSCGLPVVVADAAGSKDLVEHGVNGFILPPEPATGFVDPLHLLATNEEKRRLMGRAARGRAQSYSWSNVHAGLLANYYEALEAPLPAPGAVQSRSGPPQNRNRA